jgi:hypothetical protein
MEGGGIETSADFHGVRSNPGLTGNSGIRDTFSNDEVSATSDQDHGHVHVLRMRIHPCGH